MTAVNDAPGCRDVSVTTNEDTAQQHGSQRRRPGRRRAHRLALGRNPRYERVRRGGFTYSPAANYNGPDSFTYRANDGTVDSNAANVNVTVNAVNDAPVCQDVSIITYEDTTANTDPDCSDVDGDTLTYLVTAASHGTSGFASNKITYSPDANYNGPDSFTYKANDGTLDSNVADRQRHRQLRQRRPELHQGCR